MKKNDRFRKIEECAAQQPAVTIAELAAYIGASEATVRRDVGELIEGGLLAKRYGSVSLTAASRQGQDYFEHRRSENIEVKELLAREAAGLVRDGDTIFIESGTTLYSMVQYITAERVLAATADISIAAELAKRKNIQTLMLGGYIWQGSYIVTGEIAEQTLERFSFHKYFTSPGGVGKNGDLTYYTIQTSGLREMVVARADQTIVVAESGKYGQTGFVTNGNLRDMQVLVTDKLPDDMRQNLPESLRVVLAGSEG